MFMDTNVGADRDNGSRVKCIGEVSDREEFLFVAGTRAEARNIGREGVEEEDVENEEPCGAGISYGGELGEEVRHGIWGDV